MLAQEEYVEVHALRKRGWSMWAIARHLGRDRKTVRAHLSGEHVPGRRRLAEPDPFDTCRGLCSAAAGRRPPRLGDGFVRRSDGAGLWAELCDVCPQDPRPGPAAVVWGVCGNQRPTDGGD